MDRTDEFQSILKIHGYNNSGCVVEPSNFNKLAHNTGQNIQKNDKLLLRLSRL
jgi:hypothetical protein